MWRTGRTGATQEWLSAAVHAAALLSSTSPRVADVVGGIVGGIVGTAVRRTSWVEAAEAVVAGALATAHGKHDLAAQEYAAAVHRYDAIGSVSDAVLAAGWTARALRAAGEPASAERYAARVRAFADRNRAPGVLALMG